MYIKNGKSKPAFYSWIHLAYHPSMSQKRIPSKITDKKRWLYWLWQAKKRYGLQVLNYIVTSNHIHLLVSDSKKPSIIPDAMQLVAGRTAQEYNKRKNRR